MGLAHRAQEGDRGALARLVRRVEDGGQDLQGELREVFPAARRAEIVGVTGAPGVGKSTLIDFLIERYRSRGMTVGVVAVDPSSPVSGGAILGDRTRWKRHALDRGVFIRSLATRGAHGGLSRAAANVSQVLAAVGFDVVLVETIGVGQDSIDVTHLADITIVVTSPEGGDSLQVMKAGLMEVGDILVVNKADRADADLRIRELQLMTRLARASRRGLPPSVVRTVGTTGEGIDELMAAISDRSRAGEARSKEHASSGSVLHNAILSAMAQQVMSAARRHVSGEVAAAAERVRRGESELDAEAERLLELLRARQHEGWGGTK